MTIIRKLLSTVLAFCMVISLPVNASAYSTYQELRNDNSIQPQIDISQTEKQEWTSDGFDLWGEISDLEYFSNAQTFDDYELLMPHVEELVRSSPDVEESSIRYSDGILCWLIGDDPNKYDPSVRVQMNGGADTSFMPTAEYDSQSPDIPKLSSSSFETSSIERSSKFPQEGIADVCAFLPYSGTTKDNFSTCANVAETAASYTGGEVLCYKGKDATIDKLAKALESCAMVIIGSHGNNGAFGIINDEGITSEDKEDDHAYYSGPHYKYIGNEKVLDYDLWIIDGTAVTNHMTKDAPGNLVYSSSCMSMKTDALCKPLREHGVSVVFGWSESVTSECDAKDLAVFTDLLCSRKNVADAFVETKEIVGCQWDPMWIDFTYEQARNSAVAFPIIVSEDDEYPGEGNVNFIQTVYSTWKLPVRTDVPEKQTLSLNTQYNGYVVAETRNKIKNVAIAAGGLPSGMTYSFEDNRVVLSGTPSVKGYSVATYKITTENNETITKPVGILTADYNSVKTMSKSVEVTAHDFGKWSSGAYFESDTPPIDIPLKFESQKGTYKVIKQSGFLPCSLEYGFDQNIKGSGYIRSALSKLYSEERTDDDYSNYYQATAPGEYDIGLDFFTMAGDVVRYNVNVKVKPVHTYTISQNNTTYYMNDTLSRKVDDWHAGAVTSIEILEGSLPPGIKLLNSWHKPLGFYGTPGATGEYTIKFRISNFSDYYDYTYKLTIKDAVAKIKGNAKSVGDTLELELFDIPFDTYRIFWQISDNKESWSTLKSEEPESSYTAKPGDAKRYVRAAIVKTVNGSSTSNMHFSDIRYINPLPELTGTVFYTSGIASGMKITTARGGLLNDLYNYAPEKMHYQWQIRDNENSEWENLSGETNLTFTPTDKLIGKQIRVEATYDRYSGAVYSTTREIHKRVNNDTTPITPSVYVEAPYEKVTVINAKADQEYVAMYSTGSPDWTNAKYPPQDGELELLCYSDTTVYIYTRMRETDTVQAGMRTAYRAVYNGHIEYLRGLTFDKTSITTKVGDVTSLTVSPLPEDFSLWDDSYQLSWFVNGSEVTLYEDENCTTLLTQHSPVSNKTVYVKGLKPTSYVSVGVEKTVGYNDLRVAFCSVEVADEDGDFVLSNLIFDDVTVKQGETAIANYTTNPQPAKVGSLTFEKATGPDSELTVMKSSQNNNTASSLTPARSRRSTA